jgi:hypothetical protein
MRASDCGDNGFWDLTADSYITLEMTGSFFLNFDVAILCSRAQHLLALARKVEQGGLNG